MGRRKVSHTGHTVWQVIVILLLLALLVGVLVFEMGRNTRAVGTEVVRRSAYTVTDDLVGYVFREEQVLTSTNTGPVHYLAADGDRVQAGDALVEVYTDDTGTNKRAEAALLYEEIARLERSLEQDATVWQLSYMEQYGNMMNALGQGNWQTGKVAGEALAATLERRSILSGDGDAVRIRIATLRATADALVEYVDAPDQKTAAEAGRFFRNADGYEAMFGTAAAESLTPEGLDILLAAEPDTAGAVGKLVSTGKFYLAVPASPEVAANYTVGTSYRVNLTRGGKADMTLVRITPSADGSRMLLLWEGAQMPQQMDASRRQCVTVERQRLAGMRIPAAALNSDGEGEFVYIAERGVAVKRRVRVIGREEGSCILALAAEEGYLRTGEMVVLSPRSLYEGKVLNR